MWGQSFWYGRKRAFLVLDRGYLWRGQNSRCNGWEYKGLYASVCVCVGHVDQEAGWPAVWNTETVES